MPDIRRMSSADARQPVVGQLQGKGWQVSLPRPAAPELEGGRGGFVETPACGHRAPEAALLHEPDRRRGVVLRLAVRVGEGAHGDTKGTLDSVLGSLDLLP